MKPGFSAITSSKYYHQAFNSAIFDGPIRIYFVQFHESYALKIYFALQDYFQNTLMQYKDIGKKIESTVLVMIYPTEESFQKSFPEMISSSSHIARAINEKEIIFGLLAPVLESNIGQLMDELSGIFKTWEKLSLAPVYNSEAHSALNFDANDGF